MFSLCTVKRFISDNYSEQPENKAPMLTSSQIGTGVIDLVALAAIIAFASLILAHHAQLLNLPGLASIPNQTAYIIFGASGIAALADIILLAIQGCKKITAQSETIALLTQENTKKTSDHDEAAKNQQRTTDEQSKTIALLTQENAKKTHALEEAIKQAENQHAKEQEQVLKFNEHMLLKNREL